MNNSIVFDSVTEVFTYPDGVTETLEQYSSRKARFEYIKNLQTALEHLKVLYQNPGCLTVEEYRNAKNKIQEEFEWWEGNIFVEFEDS